jgi:hypothetical protein
MYDKPVIRLNVKGLFDTFTSEIILDYAYAGELISRWNHNTAGGGTGDSVASIIVNRRGIRGFIPFSEHPDFSLAFVDCWLSEARGSVGALIVFFKEKIFNKRGEVVRYE